MTLKIANEIEEALNNEGLVGKRMGSGFCFLDNSRDVMFEYSSNAKSALIVLSASEIGEEMLSLVGV